MSDDQRYRTSQWQAIRTSVLDRDGWKCMVDHDDCGYKAPGSLKRFKRVAHVHHVVDESEGGAFWDPHNLVSVCSAYNIAERNRRQNRRAARALSGAGSPEPVKPSRAW